MGFLLYCLIAFGLIAARLWLHRPLGRPAVRPSAPQLPGGGG
ncbi:hypothetical protein ACIP98_09215 [Streptomyces sp. NPDC088354]